MEKETLQNIKAISPLGVELYSWSAPALFWDDLSHILPLIDKELSEYTIIKDYSDGKRVIRERIYSQKGRMR